MNLSTIISAVSPETIISAVGTLGVIAVVFLETGAFFGFFFPGDSLLFTAGLLASQGYVTFAGLLVGTFLAAIIGDSVGYAFGRKVGPAIFKKEDSVFFDKKYIQKADEFFQKYGKKTIILARFVPIVRTFAPIVAGVGKMPYRDFIIFNILGAFLWTWSMLWLGYLFGSVIPDPDRYILPVILVIILVSSFPALREIFKIGIEKYKNVGK
jgi:membrane-associated protein